MVTSQVRSWHEATTFFGQTVCVVSSLVAHTEGLLQVHSTCQVLTCLAIAAIANDATFRESIVELIGLQETFLKQPSLRSRPMLGLM